MRPCWIAQVTSLWHIEPSLRTILAVSWVVIDSSAGKTFLFYDLSCRFIKVWLRSVDGLIQKLGRQCTRFAVAIFALENLTLLSWSFCCNKTQFCKLFRQFWLLRFLIRGHVVSSFETMVLDGLFRVVFDAKHRWIFCEICEPWASPPFTTTASQRCLVLCFDRCVYHFGL